MTRALKRKNTADEALLPPIASLKRKTGAKRVPGPDRDSPWQKTLRQRLNVNDLDLHRSYVTTYQPKARAARRLPRQTRWKHTGSNPLTDIKSLPMGWNSKEPDLDPNNIDGQILRCQERIADNIMPHVFQHRLREYKAIQSHQKQMALNEPTGLKLNTYERLKCLRIMEEECQRKSEDKYCQLSNIQAIMRAYRSHRLEWNGLITYWSNGIQLCEPRPFDWDEFEAINLKHEGHKGFWTEGIRLAVRLPYYDWWDSMMFLHDTGANIMNIYDSDLNLLMGPFRPPLYPQIPVVGRLRIETNSGSLIADVIEIEVALMNEQDRLLTQWTRVPCWMKSGIYVPGESVPRIDGPLLQYLMYQLTVPDGKFDLHIFTSRRSLFPLPTAPSSHHRQGPPMSKYSIELTPGTTTTTRDPPTAAVAVAGTKSMPL
ncbi:hypothetical protein N7462_000583 [Penicillium macrosclerotiorum]|uniref:uncharacterized protein n=1 Tax=Penicillium macrosclerotiorum TaxID=303699 RepID=UPI002546EB63|nr:uncharacterized protein N7462_000583 [Penicillium macrosclerotiorum]KAJ5698578.1 hypothetical protein N7462_000583 [Penicillium macrosclerotiorum]